VEAGLVLLFVALAVAVAHFVDHVGEGVVVLFAFALELGVAVGELLVGAGVALGAGQVLVVEVVELIVDAEAAELGEEGVEAGLEAGVEGVESGEGGGLLLGEVEGPDGGGGVGGVVESRVGGEVGGVGRRGLRIGGRVEGSVEEAVFDAGEVLEFPDDEGELVDEDFLRGGGGAVLFGELLVEGGVGELGGGVGDGDFRRGC